MIYIDIETFSELDVTEVGVHAYAAHWSTEIMLVCFAIDDGPVITWDRTICATPHAQLLAEWPRHRKCAHNATFERVLLNACMPAHFSTRPEDWDDTAVIARTCGLPGKLSTVCDVLGVDESVAKVKGGDRLVTLFCKPAPRNHKAYRYTRENRPDKWIEFVEYCQHDVLACRHLAKTLPQRVYRLERDNWIMDQRIGDRGLPVDLDFARAAICESTAALYEANERLHHITGGAVADVNKTAALAQFVGTESVAKDSVRTLLASDTLGPEQREALEIRQRCGRSSVAKYQRMIDSATEDGRVKDALMFYGAPRTGRDSGQLLQPHNMLRPSAEFEEVAALLMARDAVLRGTVRWLYDDPIGTIASLARTGIAAKRGRKLVVADLSNIEGRKLAWLSGEEWKLQAFRDFDAGTGPDLYRLAYARAYGIDIDDVSKFQRLIGKVMELALGYQGSVGAFESMGANYGLALPLAEQLNAVDFWRGAHPRTVKLWYSCERAALQAVRFPRDIFEVGRLAFKVVQHGAHKWLAMRLPSGRLLYYYEPRIVGQGRDSKLVYTGHIIGSTWGPVETYGGKEVENGTQASARDVLFHGLRNATAAGFEVVLHTHDEIVADCPDSDEWNVARLVECMTSPTDWFEGLPLAAAGYESDVYRKD